jgi:hypothetical protein
VIGRRDVRTISWAFTAIVLALTPTPGAAQSVERRITASAVTVSGSASTLSVVSVPLPREFPLDSRVTYVVTPRVDGAAAGRLSGVVTAGSVNAPIVFGVRATRYALAGFQEVARVRFTSATLEVEVPVIIAVETVRSITVAYAARLSVGRAGTAIPVGYRLTNLGNAADTVSVETFLPAGWRAMDAQAPIVLEPRHASDQVLTVVPPPNANGTTAIRVVVHARGAIVAESMVDVQVAGVAVTPVAAGPRLTLGLATAAGPWGGSRTLRSFAVQGPLTDGLRIAARAAVASEDDGAGYAFSRANMAPAPFAMQVASADWRVDGGVLGVSLSNLAGTNLVGRGASASVSRSSWNATAIAATPDFGRGNIDGALQGARVEFTPAASFSLSTSLSRLREWRGSSTRSLDALALGAGLSDLLGGRLEAELAGRRFDGRVVPGWATEYSKRSPNETFDLRYVNAPGGNRAFARASNEVAASAGRRFSQRLSVSGSLWRTTDDGGGTTNLTGIRMDGWTTGAHYALRPDVGVTIGVRQSALSAGTSLGEFGSGERGADASLDIRRGMAMAQVGFSAARLSRYTTPEGDQSAYRHEAARAGVRGAIGSALGRTSVTVTGHYETTGAGVGAAPIQWSYGLQVAGSPGLGLGDALRIDASAEQLGGAEGASRALTMHAGAELRVARHTALHASVERNPYVLPERGATAWMYVLGVTRSVELPRPSGHGTRGRVFRDLNGNGRADQGETGFSGVVLRRGAAIAVSDARGAFALGGDEHQPYEIDARSFPVGWLIASTIVPGATREIAAVAVSPLTVRIAVDSPDTARVARSEVSRVTASVRDASGREWLGRRVSESTLVFDALPPGRYQPIVDASATSEPLRIAGDLDVITVVGGRATPEVRVLLRARPLRFSNPKRGVS